MFFCKVSISFYFCLSFALSCNYLNDETILIKTFNSKNPFFVSRKSEVSNQVFIKNMNGLIKENEAIELWNSSADNDCDKSRILYSVGLMLCNTYATHLQCSQALIAYKYAGLMINNIQMIQNNLITNNDIDVLNLTSIMVPEYYDFLVDFMNLIHILGYVQPKYLVLTSLYAHELVQIIKLPRMMDIDNLLQKMANDVQSAAKQFINQCQGTLIKQDIENITIPNSMGFQEILSVNRKELQSTRESLIGYKFHNRFRVNYWLLTDRLQQETFLDMLFSTQTKYLNINWNKLKTQFSNTFPVHRNSNWKYDMYNASGTPDSIQNKLINVYRTVVLRHTLIVTLDCVNLYDMKETNEKFSSTCDKIVKMIHKAAWFIQKKDIFIEKLYLSAKKFVENDRDSSYDVLGMVIGELSRLSQILDVNANNNYIPVKQSTSNEYVITTTAHIKAAADYIDALRNELSEFFFDVINSIQKSVENEWILSTQSFELVRKGLLVEETQTSVKQDPVQPSALQSAWNTLTGNSS